MYLFFLILFAIELFYFFVDFFISGLFAYYGYTLQGGLILLGVICTHSIIFFALLLLSYGVLNRRTWTRKFMIFFLFWASLWAIWGLIVGNNILVHLILLIIYMLMIFYLTTNEVKEYFARMLRYGKYVLYTRMVTLKSGLQLPIYFFSSHTPKSGHPTSLPDGYIVKENETSHMPYLKKDHPNKTIKKRDAKTSKRDRMVIYVVNASHTDRINGSWAVKGHNQIFSSHPTKRLAIKKAREVALQKHATVMVQNTNGRFSYGFKPKQA